MKSPVSSIQAQHELETTPFRESYVLTWPEYQDQV